MAKPTPPTISDTVKNQLITYSRSHKLECRLPLRQGNPRRLINTYKRNGTVNLMAALAVHIGEITARQVYRNNSEKFLKFLKHLDHKYRNVTIHITLDNLSTHKNKAVRKSKRKGGVVFWIRSFGWNLLLLGWGRGRNHR